MTKLFIGIGHRARAGKDTVAQTIHREYPAMTHVIGLADALKAYCRVAAGMREKDPVLLQEIGMKRRKSMGEDFWINILRHTAEERPERVILVPDVRFLNEAEWIKAHGGFLIKVERRHPDGRLFVATDRPADHPSELELADYLEWDYIIENIGPVGNLRAAALTVFEDILDKVAARKEAA